MKFQQLSEKLGKRESKKLANNTYVIRISESEIVIRLHQTSILTFHKNGKVIINSGNWRTLTTKDRLNSFLPFGQISQDKGHWFFHTQGENAQTYFFKDGFSINEKTGKVYSKPFDASNKDAMREKKLRKDVLNFCKAYVECLFSGEMEKPGAGDCFYCQMRDVKTNKPLPGNDHLLSHIEESYFVPSLLLCAAEEFPNFLSPIAKGTVYQLWEKMEVSNWALDVSKLQVLACLRKYMYTQLGLAS